MDKIIWDDAFSVGIREMDQQHLRIVEMINTLIEKSDAAVDSEILAEVLAEMIDYARTHLKEEEKLLLEHDYPDYPSHRKQHGEFRKRSAFFCIDTMSKRPSIPEEVLAYLKDWLVNHILVEDSQYGVFLREKGVR